MNASVKHCDRSTSVSSLSRSEATAWCVAFATEALAVVVFNLITIAIFATNKRLRERKFYLLLNLTVADLIVGAIAVPYFVYILGDNWELWGNKQGGKNVMAVTHVDVFSGFSSIINLAMIAVERSFATFWPFRYHVLPTKVYIVSIALIWIIASLPPSLLAMTSSGLLSPKQQAYVWVPFTVILFLVMCISYASILIKVRRGKQRRVQGVTERNRKLTMSLLLLTSISLLTWMPFAILHALVVLGVYRTCDVNVHYILRLLHYANSLVNPIIYVMRIPNTRIRMATALDFKRFRSTKRVKPPLLSPPKILDTGLLARQGGGKNCNYSLPRSDSGTCTLTRYQVNPTTSSITFGTPPSSLSYPAALTGC